MMNEKKVDEGMVKAWKFASGEELVDNFRDQNEDALQAMFYLGYKFGVTSVLLAVSEGLIKDATKGAE